MAAASPEVELEPAITSPGYCTVPVVYQYTVDTFVSHLCKLTKNICIGLYPQFLTETS